MVFSYLAVKLQLSNLKLYRGQKQSIPKKNIGRLFETLLDVNKDILLSK